MAPVSVRADAVFGPHGGLVVGFYAEASPDVYHLVEAAADRASRRWGVWGARSQTGTATAEAP